MSFEFTGAWMVPGIQGSLETFENQFWWGRWENQIWSSIVLSGATRDSGNTNYTTTLRPGLLLGKVASTNKVVEWAPTAADGSEKIFGILGPATNAQRLGANQDRWLGMIMVGGTIKPDRLLIPGETNLGISGHALEHLIRAQLFPRFMISGDFHGNAFGGWTNIRAVTAATYTVTENDNGTLFTNRGAAGNSAFTLPVTAKKGLRYGFYSVAAGTLTVTAGTADTLVGHDDNAADSIAFSTAGEIIGNHIEVIGDGTGWLVINHLGDETVTPTIAS